MRVGSTALLAVVALASPGLGSVAAQARPATQTAFDLPPMSLASALSRFAEVAHVQVLFDPAMVGTRNTGPLRGTFTTEAALVRLLAHTGLEFTQPQSGLFVIRRAVIARPVRSAPPDLRPALRPIVPPAMPAIIVTAARRSQQLSRVSATVDVVPGAVLASAAISDAGQALAGITGVSTTSQPGGVSINIRGLGADMPSGATQGSVALEFDGIYSIIALGTATGFFDVDHVEVVRGPQGTRYGPNAEGGVVNVISRAPTLGSMMGHADLTVGSAELVRVEAAQDIPLGTMFALRLAGAATRRNSWFTPPLANAVAQAFRARLLFEPSPALQVRLAVQVDRTGGTGSGSEAGYPIIISRVAPYPGDSINAAANPWALGDRAQGSYDPASSRANLVQTALSGGVTWQADDHVVIDATLSHLAIAGSQTSCARSGSPWSTTGDGICYGVHEFAPFGQSMAELRLHSPDRAAWQWDLGAYFWEFGKTSWAEAFQAVPGPAGAQHTGTRTLALFGETTVPLTPRLRLVAGARESLDRRELRPAGVDTLYHVAFSHADFRLGEEFDLAPQVMQYASLASGYRPGGLSYDGAIGTASSFASEETVAAETGIKTTLWHNRLQLNLAAFAYRQRHYQDLDNYNGYTVTLPGGEAYLCGASGGQPPACSLPSFTIPHASNIGLEWQARISPDRQDRLAINGALMRARFGHDLGACATIAASAGSGCWIGYNDQITGALHFFDIAGAVQPHSPTLSINLAYERDIALPSGWTITPGGNAEHNSSYWTGPVEDTALLGFQPGYWLWNANLRFAAPNHGIRLTAWARNLTGYAVKMSSLPATTIGEPRNYGITAMITW